MKKFLSWWLIALLVVALDQWSKWWVNHHLFAGQVLMVASWFDWVLAHNPGAAFSILADGQGWQKAVLGTISLTAIGFIAYLITRPTQTTLSRLGLSLIMGGAMGNLVDRLLVGEVTDFVQWHLGNHYWPAFNLADSAITLGVVLLLWEQFKKP
jgi:signal peptidase II